MRGVLFGVVLILCGCMGMPESVTPVKGFDLARYLGRWYEIARLDHSFERGLDQVSADYSLREDGTVVVRNLGFSMEKNRWKEAEGKAFFAGNRNEGYLKVSFFGPFYGSYVVFEVDKDYRYAFVCGQNRSYLWLLSRTPVVGDGLIARFVNKAESLGFQTEGLIYVNQKKGIERTK